MQPHESYLSIIATAVFYLTIFGAPLWVPWLRDWWTDRH